MGQAGLVDGSLAPLGWLPPTVGQLGMSDPLVLQGLHRLLSCHLGAPGRDGSWKEASLPRIIPKSNIESHSQIPSPSFQFSKYGP